MDAKELTKEFSKQQRQIDELQKAVKYLEQEVEKLRMLMDDLKIDVEMLGAKSK